MRKYVPSTITRLCFSQPLPFPVVPAIPHVPPVANRAISGTAPLLRAPDHTTDTHRKPIGTSVKGQSGNHYILDTILQDKGIPFGRVYLATHVFCKTPRREVIN